MYFERKIFGKKASIYIQLDNDKRWGGQGLCPWCGVSGKIIVSDFSTKIAAKNFFFEEMATHCKYSHNYKR